MSIQQTCPLCDTPATYTISNDPYCKHFTCSVCKEFFIDASSEKHLGGLVEVQKTEFRKKLSAAAQATQPREVFVIREPNPEERRGEGNGRTTNLIAKHLTL